MKVKCFLPSGQGGRVSPLSGSGVQEDCYALFAQSTPIIVQSCTWRENMTQHRGGSGNFAEDKQRASEAGRKGGQKSGGNFRHDPERASEAGRKGGQNIRGGRSA